MAGQRHALEVRQSQSLIDPLSEAGWSRFAFPFQA